MKNTIALSTIYVLVFILSLNLTGTSDFTLIMFVFSPIVILNMAYRILRSDYSTSKTFDKRFYQDYDDERVNIK